MYWQGGKSKIQNPSEPQALQEALFHAWFTLKVAIPEFSPRECRITLVMTEKEWGLTHKKKDTWKAAVVWWFGFFFATFSRISYLHF